MAIFKCKMCGGALEITENSSVATCEYCGTEQTLPRLDTDKKTNLYDRANHFRRNNDYDKAMSIYEQILNEDNTDAEAYWSLVLCKYGIEYVEDPVSHKRIPTVNRAQYTSIYADENYKSAISHADSYQKNVYEQEAKNIDDIQRGILSISEKEEPFDVFICYKETDESGRRTPDSVLANDLYHQLTQEGFKVFFARITLEDKLGQEYEPYIFAALNSAKVMVVLGTKPEYYNAVWVKNEWSRYLALISSGAKKMLIPAYKDMDPYDLPEEFSHLQAQDMSKLGFMQDLIRGIKKIIGENEPHNTTKETVVVQQQQNVVGSNITALLKRGNMALEDKEWDKADGFFEEVLNHNAECAEAYFGKWLAWLKASNMLEAVGYYENSMFAEVYETTKIAVEENEQHINEMVQKYIVEPNYLTADTIRAQYKFDREYNSELDSMKTTKPDIIREVENNKLYSRAKQYASGESSKVITSIYDAIVRKLDSIIAETEQKENETIESIVYRYNQAIAKADKTVQELYKKAAAEKENDYQSAIASYNAADTVHMCGYAKDDFVKLNGYRDSEIYVQKCEEKIKAIEQAEEHAAEQRKQEQLQRARKNLKRAIAVISTVIVIIIAFKVANTVVIPAYNYSKATELLENGEYDLAMTAFKKLGDYKDSVDQVKEAQYMYAQACLGAGEYVEAGKLFKELGDYKDSTDQYRQIILQIAKQGNVGDVLYFGNYEWQILTKENNQALLITTGAVCLKAYNEEEESITWEKCTLRKWLNGEFYNEFSDEEKHIIATTHLENKDNSEYGTDGGNDTDDKVFLLSIDEVNTYFTDDDARAVGYSWWLRSPGLNVRDAAYVVGSGWVRDDGSGVYDDRVGIRPALWLNLES